MDGFDKAFADKVMMVNVRLCREETFLDMELIERVLQLGADVDAEAAAEAVPGTADMQWGVRTTYTDGSGSISWDNEEEARSFLTYYAETDAEPYMRVRTRELVRRPVVAGDVEVVESDYGARRCSAEERIKERRTSRS